MSRCGTCMGRGYIDVRGSGSGFTTAPVIVCPDCSGCSKCEQLEAQVAIEKESGDVARRGLEKVTEMNEQLEARVEELQGEVARVAVASAKRGITIERVRGLPRCSILTGGMVEVPHGQWVNIEDILAALESK